MTLNNIIDDIMLILRNNSISESEHISRILVEKWIHTYRAFLIKLDIDKGYEIHNDYIQYMPNVHIDKTTTDYGKNVYKADVNLPLLLKVNRKPVCIYVKDMFGNMIQTGSETKAKLLKYRKATCGDTIAWYKNKELYIEGGDNQLEYIEVGVIAEDPSSFETCFDPNADYPMPINKISVLKELIFSKELSWMMNGITDKTNDSNDDTQNVPRK